MTSLSRNALRIVSLYSVMLNGFVSELTIFATNVFQRKCIHEAIRYTGRGSGGGRC